MRFLAVLAMLITPLSQAATLSGGRLVEDFSTDEYADYNATTGLWNTVDHLARAGVTVDSSANRPISFGDGSDGILDTTNGYSFDTDAKPNGYNFKQVNITGGSVTVTGTNPLIIRSLTTLTITPAIDLRGGAGNNGSTVASSTVAGGTARACRGNGGSGGAVVALAGQSGGGGIVFDSTIEAGTAGAGATNGNASDANATTTGPGAANTWDTVVNSFVCGTSGGGGGGATQGVNFSTGGSGGAGGGAIRLVAVGDLTVGAVDVRGGDGGLGLANGGATCSGHGSAGAGGAAWFQTLHTLTAPNPTIAAAASGTGNGCGGGSGAGLTGRRRGDAETAAGALAATFATANAAPAQSYVVQSKAYDLNTLNAVFNGTSIASQANGGSIAISYAGSADGSSFSDFTQDVTQLSGKRYRFLKFKIAIATAGAAGPSPQVSQVAIDYRDGGLEKIELDLSPGCGTVAGSAGGRHAERGAITSFLAFWTTFWALAYIVTRHGHSAVNTTRRAIANALFAKSRPEIT